MQLQIPIRRVFDQLQGMMHELTDAEYASPIPVLSGNSVGKHVRHILEMYQCLLEGYATGHVNYAHRRRDPLIENTRSAAIDVLRTVSTAIDIPNKPLTISADYPDARGEAIAIDSNYHRELAFNLEHTIHHMALIRIGVEQGTRVSLPDSFGVAFATVNFRKQCAQ